jgi:SPOR domain
MALHRPNGSRNMLRGVLAFFWIALAGVSGVYLYSAFANPASLDSQLANPLPVGSGEMTSAFSGSGGRGQELAEIKASLRKLTQQMAAISTKLNLENDASTSTEDTADADAVSEPEKPEVAAATPPPPPASPVEQMKPAEAPKPAPQPETKPVEQAAVEVKPAPKPFEPPAVAVAPIDDLPVEEETETSSEEPAPTPPPPVAEPTPAPTPAANPSTPEPSTPATTPPPEPTESAALDPVALPPAANDGSTRYGIEIGVVAKQDGLRPLWREFLTKHAALVAGLQPRRVLAPDKKWRLIAGPFSSADEASQACALFKKASRPCEATVYAGDSL